MAELDLDLVRHALAVARDRGLAEIELESGDSRFHAVLTPRKAKPPTPAQEAAAEADLYKVVKAPSVGYFRFGAQPLEAGASVKKGDAIGIVVALGLANAVESSYDGVVEEWLVEQDQAVEFGQALLRVKVSP